MGFTTSYSLTDLGAVDHPLANYGADAASLPNGNIAVVANHNGLVQVTRFGADGVGVGVIYGFTAQHGALSGLSDGGTVLAANANGDISFNILNANFTPVTSGNVGEDNTQHVGVAGLAGGGFAIVSEDFVVAGDSRIDWRIYGSGGGFIAGNAVATGIPDHAPSVAALADGGFAVAFHREAAVNVTELWYMVFDANGTVRKAATLLDNAGSTNIEASVIALPSGGFGIAYSDNGWGTGGLDISFARLDAAGTHLGTTNISQSGNHDSRPSTTLLSNGLVVVGSDVFVSAASDNNAVWTLVDPNSGAILASTTTGSIGTRNEIETAVAGMSLGRIGGFFTDSAANEVVGVHLQAVRVSIGDSAGDTFQGDELRDIVHAGGGHDILAGGANADQLFGEAGDDQFYFTDELLSRDLFDGGLGFDTLIVGQPASVTGATVRSLESVSFSGLLSVSTLDVLAGQIGDGFAANLHVLGFVGTDTLRVLMRSETVLDLTAFTFTQFDGDDRIVIIGDTSAETIIGSAVRDDIAGGGGNDRMTGRGGVDRLLGGGGNDIFFVNAAGEAIESLNQGNDLVLSVVDYQLGANLERLQLLGTGDLRGTGNNLANALTGNAGANLLNGLGGNDTMTGGGGADRFAFTTGISGPANVDLIADFAAVDDTILLDRSVFDAISGGRLAAGAFRAGAVAADASDRILYDQATGRIFYDSDGTGAAERILFARVDAGIALSAADFVANGAPNPTISAAALRDVEAMAPGLSHHMPITLMGPDHFIV